MAHKSRFMILKIPCGSYVSRKHHYSVRNPTFSVLWEFRTTYRFNQLASACAALCCDFITMVFLLMLLIYSAHPPCVEGVFGAVQSAASVKPFGKPRGFLLRRHDSMCILFSWRLHDSKSVQTEIQTDNCEIKINVYVASKCNKYGMNIKNIGKISWQCTIPDI